MAQGIFNLKQVNQAIRQGAWSAFNPPQFVEYLVVAGGGSGGLESYSSGAGGGGGAGGLLTGMVSVTAGASYTVTVGAGGASIVGTNAGGGSIGNNGFNSVFGFVTATGGGAGAGGSSPANVGVGNGGSGGGGEYVQSPGSGTTGQGNQGGLGQNVASGGGGGGAGTQGLNAISQNVAGNGGAGIASNISGTVTTYAGGGGGCGYAKGGTGGVGGGGQGAIYSAGAQGAGSGTTNTGGGGGGAANGAGAYNLNQYTSGAGGSGIVIVRYPGNVVFYTGGTVNYNNGYISHIFNSNGTLAPTAPAAYNTSYQISRSLRFNNPTDTAYLNRTPATTTNRRTFTFSAWVKLGTQLSTNYYRTLFGNGYAVDYMLFMNTNTFAITSQNQTDYYLETTQVFRDSSAWYHLVIAFDTTQATSSNRIKIYVNGVQVTAFSTSTYPSQNYDTGFNTNTTQYIGWNEYNYYNGHMTEVNFIDGQQLTPSSFGATSTTTGVWAPIKYTGTYGTNGFYLNFSDNTNTTATTLGKDYSGNGNNWTPNNFSVTAGAGNDSMVDVPTSYGFDTGVGGEVRGNYATWNPLKSNSSTSTYQDGNLQVTFPSVSAGGIATATMAVSSGKFYWEITVGGTDGNTQPKIGVISPTVATETSSSIDIGTYGYAYGRDGNKTILGTATAYGASFTTGDVIGFALDMDAGTLVCYKNNASQGTLVSGLSGLLQPGITAYNGYIQTANFGQRPFAYTAPSGFKALCTQNLPTPAIGGSSETLANEFFDINLYTGTGATQAIVNSGAFQPDWIWIKDRNTARSHRLMDSVRGINKILYTDLTNAEDTGSCLSSINSNGFTLNTTDNMNLSAETYVAWQWKAGNNAFATNTSGSITSQVSASPTSGFSIVTFIGTAGNVSVGHGLGVTPTVTLVKSRAGGNWWYYTTQIDGSLDYLELNTTTIVGNASQSSPTPTVFYQNQTDTSVAYCFAPIAGFSAFSKYTGNGSADGPFIYTGFKPAFVMIKRTDTSAAWIIKDTTRSPFNADGNTILPNASDVEYGSGNTEIDELSNGFKCRTTSASANASGGTYIYMAFASNPFKYSLAR